MIQVDKISKSFGSIKAVDDLSFQIKEGEIVGLLGPNGAGKTTTMRLVTGYLSPDRGTITVNTTNVAVDPLEVQKTIGYLPENNPLYKDMLVYELLDFIAALRNLRGKEKKEGIDFAVDATKIGDVFFRPIGELSKGYKQRVGMATALLHRPNILILDEPTEGLDPNQRTEMRSLIKQLSKHHTIVISTHVMQEVEAVCNRILIINRGKLVADGTPDTLRKKQKGGLVASIEGVGVLTALEKMAAVAAVEKLKSDGKRVDVRLISKPKSKIQPELTKLAGEKKWTIWSMNEERQHLEDVFAELTA